MLLNSSSALVDAFDQAAHVKDESEAAARAAVADQQRWRQGILAMNIDF